MSLYEKKINLDVKIVVYTAMLGHYDFLKSPPVEFDAVYICFSDMPANVPQGWNVIIEPIETDIDKRVRRARYFKTHPQELFNSHEYSVWIDANLTLLVDPRILIEYALDTGIATFSYPDTYGPRDCLYDEALACIERNKDRKLKIEEQMERYRSEGYPPGNGLVETSLLVRKNTSIIQLFNDTWWQEIEKGSYRDQLSFNYAMWKLGASYNILPGSRKINPFTTFQKHRVNIYT